MEAAVYIARNKRLKETYVGATTGPGNDLKKLFASASPFLLKAWDFAAPEVLIEVLAAPMPVSDAFEFIEHYAATVSEPGWKTLSCNSVKQCCRKESGRIVCSNPDCSNLRCPFQRSPA